MNIIKLKKVNKIYRQPVKNHVLYDINLSIEAGDLCSVIGESGSGKTTLMNIIGTLDDATSGEIIIKDKKIKNLTDNQVAKLRNQVIGFIFQFHFLLPEFTVIENVLMPSEIKGDNGADKVKRARELLEFVGLGEFTDKPANMISGGQQQRTAIARALMNNPDIILADEPTGNLDTESSKSVFKLFCKINREFNTTFLLVTHSKRIAKNTDRIITVKDGKIIEDQENLNNRACDN